ncbi:hypothetical protein STEG23_000124, partial [Scotinomys teguina]
YDVECFLVYGNGTVVVTISCLSLTESLLAIIVHIVKRDAESPVMVFSEDKWSPAQLVGTAEQAAVLAGGQA